MQEETKKRGPYKVRPYDAEKHCGAKVERDPVLIQAKIDKLTERIESKSEIQAAGFMNARIRTSEAVLVSRRNMYLKKIGIALAAGPEGDQRPCVKTKGQGTDHPGDGHCRFHCVCRGKKGWHKGTVKHGVYSKTKNKVLMKLMDEMEEAGHDLLDLTPDVKALRAFMLQFCDENDAKTLTPETVKSLTLLTEQLRKQIETMNEIRLRTAITREVFDVIMMRMGEVVMAYVTDPDVVEKIVLGWQRVSADPQTKRQRAIMGGTE